MDLVLSSIYHFSARELAGYIAGQLKSTKKKVDRAHSHTERSMSYRQAAVNLYSNIRVGSCL